MHSLIVDDLLHNRKLLSDILSTFGECDTASDGQEAIELFYAKLVDGMPYDLVLLDIMMPGIDGKNVLKKMRQFEKYYKTNKESVIIMVSASDDSQDVLDAFYRGGCDDYMVKPISKDALVEKIKASNIL
jgi:two-component system chemotaxis response regulator CheY